MRLGNAPSIALSGRLSASVSGGAPTAGYPLRFAAYVVDQGCVVSAREAFVNGHREIPCRAE